MNRFQKLAIAYYANIFVPIESKLSFLNNSRKYSKLEKLITECLIYIFDDKSFMEDRLDFLFNNIYDYQLEYYEKLSELTAISSKQKTREQEIKRTLTLENRIIEFKSILDEIDNTKCSFTTAIQKVTDDSYDIQGQEKLLETIFDKYSIGFNKYAETVEKYKVVGDDERNKLNLHTSDTFINEFHQFFTHYSYAHFAWAKQEDDKHTSFTNFINKNVDRSIKHLERAVLDIYKIISVILMRNEKDFKKNQFVKITNARNFEICNISNSLEDKIEHFIKIVDSQE